jgi:hypothetical protein
MRWIACAIDNGLTIAFLGAGQLRWTPSQVRLRWEVHIIADGKEVPMLDPIPKDIVGRAAIFTIYNDGYRREPWVGDNREYLLRPLPQGTGSRLVEPNQETAHERPTR